MILRRGSIILLAAAVFSFGVGPAVVTAQPAEPTAEDPAVVRAREQFREGVALMAAQDWAAALVKFKAVGQVRMNAQVAFNIAECERELGKLVSALGNYRLALAKAQEGGAEKVATAAPDRIAQIEPRIAKLRIVRREPKSNPRAIIELDGAELGATQIGSDIRVDPGERTVRLTVDGKTVKTERVKLGDGETRELILEIPAPEEAPMSGAPAVSVGGPSVPGIVLTAVGGATLVAGFVFIGLRQQAISDLDALCGGDASCPPSAQDTYDRGRLMTGLAEVFIPVGAAATVTGIVLLATMSAAASTDDAGPVVSLSSPDGQGPGLTIAGRF